MMGEVPSDMARIGVSIIWRAEFTIVITETYRSPPTFERTLLQDTDTIALVNCMIKAAVPRPMMLLAVLPQFFISEADMILRLYAHLSPKKNLRTYMAERACEITVAIAAPSGPRPKTKIKMGSRMMLAAAPTTIVVMPATA